MSLSIDVDFPGLSTSCKSAMNSTVKCDGLLVEVMQEAISLSPENLISICVNSCALSLQTAQDNIASACSAATDVIVLGDLAYTATYSLNELKFTYNVTCQKDVLVQLSLS